MDRTHVLDKFNRGEPIIINNELKNIYFNDEYDHLNDDIEYVPENVLQSNDIGSDTFRFLEKQFNTYLSISCQCEHSSANDVCHINSTRCRHGGNYQSSAIFSNSSEIPLELVLNPNRPSKDLIYECSEQCSCPSTCNNRLVQFGPRKLLQITDFTSLHKNLGLITLRNIPAGGFICEYAGEILTKEEAARRHLQNDLDGLNNYIICLNECSIEERGIVLDSSQSPRTTQTFIDPSRKGNVGRYLNHSCDPNCEINSVRIDGPIPKLGIFAKRNIAAMEELCFDYGESGYPNCLDESSEVASIPNRKVCYCGSKICRKYLPNLSE